MKFNGPLSKASLENLASAPSGPIAGQLYYDTVLNCARYYNGGAWVSLTLQSTFDQLSPLTTKGDLLGYSGSANVRLPGGTSGQVLTYDPTQTAGIKWSAAAGGSKNYVTYNNFENNATTGWSLVNTALDSNKNPTTVSNPGAALATAQYIFTITSGNATAGATYTNNSQTFTVVNTIAAKTILVCTGTGAPAASGTLTKATGTGDATITFSAFKLTTVAGTLSFTTTATNPLAGTYSGSLASSGATTAGDMLISDPFTIDQEDQAQVLAFLARYKLLSGTGVWAGNNTNTYAAWIYDVTNGAWIQPAGVYNFIQSSGVGKASGTFQTPSNGSQFQFAIVNINATSGAITTLVDDISVGPQQTSSGAAMSDLTAWTPTFTGFGTVTGVTAYSKIVGDELVGKITFTAGTVTASIAAITLGYNGGNSNVTIDPNKIATNSIVGHWARSGTTTGEYNLPVLASPSGTALNFGLMNGTNNSLSPSAANNMIGNSETVSLFFSVPVQGKSSNTLQSADFAGTIVGSQVNTLSSTTATAGTALQFTATGWDYNGSIQANGVFKSPSTGLYDWTFTGAWTSAAFNIDIYVNGVVRQTTAFAIGTANTSAAGQLQLNASDLVTFVPHTSATFGATGNVYATFSKRQGSAVVQASESVNVSAYGATTTVGTGISPRTVIVFPTVDYSSHGTGTYNNATGVFTANISGKFRFTANVMFNAFTLGTTQEIELRLQQAGSDTYQLDRRFGNGASNNWAMGGSKTINMKAGDTCAISGYSTVSAALAGGQENNLSIERVGN